MKKERKVDNWIKMTKYIHYIEAMIERKLKEQYHLSIKEFYVLYEIYKSENKKYKINDLIKVVDLSQSAMSRLIVRMENTETPLVYRQECLEDQRAMYIYLTGCGEKVTQTALNTYDQLLKQVNLKSISALTNMDENG